MSSSTGIDPRRFREVLGNYPTGVTVVTAVDRSGSPAGMAVGSFTSVSLDPPLVAFLADKASTSFPRIRTAASFCVNVLAADQEALCRAFAVRGGDKFAGVRWSPGPSGAPRLDGVAAWIDCELDSVTEVGDHYLVLGRVRGLHAPGDRLPLVFFQGGYGRFSPSSLVVVPEADLIGHLRLADLARPEMERVAAESGTECVALAPVSDQLVTLASAGRPPGSGSFARVGQRVPFVPPIGTVLLAWSDEAAVEAWLGRGGDAVDAAERSALRGQLDRVRTRGWSLSLRGGAPGTRPDQHTELLATNAADSSGSPARGLAEEPPHQSEPPGELDPDVSYDARALSVPVFGSDGSVPLALMLWGLPNACPGASLQRLVDGLRAASARITTALETL